MAFGFEIRRLRKDQGISVQKMADSIGVDAGRWRKWEELDMTPRHEDAKKIEKFFGMSLEVVMKLKNLKNFEFVPHVTENVLNDDGQDENKNGSVRQPKIHDDHEKEGITFVPINAQAGYSKKLADPVFTRSLQKLFIPGLPYRGESYRVFEVEGNSMEPTFVEHLHVLAEKVDQDQWKNVKDYYAYVLITEDGVLIKRIFKKSDKLWVLISDNEDLYPQFLQPVAGVKELWFIKRKLDWEMAPPKRFEIKL